MTGFPILISSHCYYRTKLARRTNKKLTQRLRKAGVRNNKTIESFDFSFNMDIDKSQIINLATCNFTSKKVSVLLVGPCGTGKNHIAQAIGHCGMRHGAYLVTLEDDTFRKPKQFLKTAKSPLAKGTKKR